jgi:hypothetical protein
MLNNPELSGFSRIFPIKELSIFSPEEMGLLFGNPEEDWSRESEYKQLILKSITLLMGSY